MYVCVKVCVRVCACTVRVGRGGFGCMRIFVCFVCVCVPVCMYVYVNGGVRACAYQGTRYPVTYQCVRVLCVCARMWGVCMCRYVKVGTGVCTSCVFVCSCGCACVRTWIRMGVGARASACVCTQGMCV